MCGFTRRVTLNRRRALLLGGVAAVGLAASRTIGVASTPARAHSQDRLSPQQALQRLIDGNNRFSMDAAPQADISTARRAELTGGQQPFAALVSCADSRVPPEIIFDQGLGDLFVCRIAGNIVDAGIAGSIEYAVGVLGVSLVFVLGHEECGAVKAAVAATESDSSISPNIDVLVNAIRPAVERVRSQSGNLLDNAIRENIRLGVQSLHAEPDLQPFVQSGAIEIVGGEYNLSSGIVELIQ